MLANHEISPSPRVRIAGLLLGLLWLVGAAAFFACFAWWYWPWGSSGRNPNEQPRLVVARGELSAAEKMNVAIYEQASPSVVHVTNLATSSGRGFKLDVQQIPKGTGSGFVWDQDGHVVTNYHVVENADEAQVTLADHSTHRASKIWADPDGDVAVLWIEARKSELHPIQIGSSHDLKVGQLAYAIGNPFGLDHSMTEGIVSALGREIEAESGRPIRGAIQTSAAINPGNSGGPLLDSAGRLIGMNTAILSPSGGSAGIGFAIPVDEINRIVPELIRNGRVVRPQLGVQLAGDQLAQQLGIDEGVLIIKVVPDSAAAQAGLRGTRRDESGRIQIGDAIVSLDGKPISNVSDLYAVLDRHKPGDTLAMTIVRDGQRQDLKVTLQAR